MMSRCGPSHQPMTAAKALYIGKAAPHATYDGLDSLQKPLCELYRKTKWDPKKVYDHMESNIHVFTSGILMKPCNPLDKDVWYKIQDLESCSAVKAYNDPNCRGRFLFVPCDSATGSMSEHPAIFALIMKRKNGGMKISDCHAFICHSDRAAMTLVRATAQAFSDQSGWTDERPTLVQLGLERPEVKLDNECYVDDLKDDCTPEYYDKPKLSGFFYTPRSDLIQKYDVKGEDGYGRPIGEGPSMIEHFTNDEFEPPPRVVERPKPAQQTAVIVVQNGGGCCPDSYCCEEEQVISCQSSRKPMAYRKDVQQQMMAAQPQQSQQSYVIVPEQAQMLYAANGMGDWRSGDQMKKGSKNDKKRNQNVYVDQSQMYPPQIQQYMDANGDHYIVDEQICTTGCGDPLYTKFLPHNGVSAQQAQMYHSQQPVDYRQGAMMSGMGDYGPPQGVEYVEYRGGGQGNGDADLYSRRLPGGQGRNYDGNFVLKKGDGYGGYGGINMGGLRIADQY